MFHLWLNPRPPSCTGCVTFGHAVDSSAIVIASGTSANTIVFNSCRKAIASRFSRPP
jgi:hypothetical protein